MKIEFINNASVLITLLDGRTILTDPWYSDGIYCGSWYNFPPIENKTKYLNLKPDYIYISHIHPDHFDPNTLKSFPRKSQIILGNLSYLKARIELLGFNKIECFELNETREYQGINITILGEFSGSSDGQLRTGDFNLDTSIHIEDINGETLFHNVDNPIQLKDAEWIVNKLGSPTISLLPYSSAGPFPHSFLNYTHEQKINLRDDLVAKCLKKFLDLSKIFSSSYILPVAGTFVFGGSIADYSLYLSQPIPSQIKQSWQTANFKNSELFILFEGDVLDTQNKSLTINSQALYRDFNEQDRYNYALTKKTNILDFEQINIPLELFIIPWYQLFSKARKKLWEKQLVLKCFPHWKVEFDVQFNQQTLDKFCFYLDRQNIEKKQSTTNTKAIYSIKFEIDYRLMLMVLIGSVSWDTVMAGSLAQTYREPDIYDRQVYDLMIYLFA